MISAAILMCLMPVPNDGDTARCGVSRTTVRLFAVKSVDGTPEDAAAKVALTGLATGGWQCEAPPHGPVTSYTRMVAICFNYLGADVGKQLILTGKATEDCAYSVHPTRHPRGYYGTCP